jgi:transcription initiation factor TFIID TATA-box-binding protein
LNDDLFGSQFDPENFPGVIYRIPDPKAAILIYRTGKLISTGSDSIAAAQDTLRTVVEEFDSLGIDISDLDEIVVHNIVTSGELCDGLNLNTVAIGLGLENIEYEPEQFPGLIYRPDDIDVAILLFGSGKLVVTGGQTIEQIDRGFEYVKEELESLGLV